MKTQELMIGDWVSLGDNSQNAQVIGMATSSVITTSEDGDILQYSDLLPIPLTEDILKANGFVNDWKQLELEYIDKGNGWFVVDVEAESIEDGVVAKWCRYVHEVQHALRICKRNELADNFKLE